MNITDQIILNFLETERISVLSILQPNNSPHSAAVHFSTNLEINNTEFFFSIDKRSRKAGFLTKSAKAPASLVIGFSENEWKTLQLNGEISAIQDDRELKNAKVIHYNKNPASKKFEVDPNTIFLKFIPHWFRYTDFLTDPLTIIEHGK